MNDYIKKDGNVKLAKRCEELLKQFKYYEDKDIRLDPRMKKYFDHKYFLEIALLFYFASHLVDRNLVDYTQVREDYINMKKEEFLEKYKMMIKDEWQIEKPGFHRNWFNFSKLEDMLKKIGFKKVIRSECRKSIFTEMCAPEFDRTHPENSLYIDAIK